MANWVHISSEPDVSSKTKTCRYKVDRTEATPRENRIKLLASGDSDEAPDYLRTLVLHVLRL